jgi:hypothetical protein
MADVPQLLVIAIMVGIVLLAGGFVTVIFNAMVNSSKSQGSSSRR